jgi:hypothetical protein
MVYVLPGLLTLLMRSAASPRCTVEGRLAVPVGALDGFRLAREAADPLPCVGARPIEGQLPASGDALDAPRPGFGVDPRHPAARFHFGASR